MGVLADQLSAIRVSASAPGGGVHAELRGFDEVEIYFSSDFYQQTDNRELGHRLEAVARLLWTAQERAQRRVRSELGAGGSDVPETTQDVAFFAARDQLTAVGRSDDDRITISVIGMREWQVRLADDTLRAYNERDFLAQLSVAVHRLIRDQAQQILRLKGLVYR
jgi:hypothetical protein